MAKTGSLRDRLQALARPRVHEISFEDEKYWVREMTGADRDLIQQWINAHPDGLAASGSEARMATIFLCDETGARLYDSGDASHIDQINEMPITFIRAVNQKGNRISGLSGEAVEEAKANFPATPSDDSTSDSPETLAA